MIFSRLFKDYYADYNYNTSKTVFKQKNIESISVLFPGCGKCNSPVRQASVGIVTPSDLSRYEFYLVDDIQAYVRDDVRKHKDSVTISLSRFLWQVELVAD